MKEVYLYFRTQATLASDDDKAQSCCFPLSAFSGMMFNSSNGTNKVTFHFRSLLNNFGYDETADTTDVVSDVVQINLKDTATNREFRKEFAEAIDSASMKLNSKFLVIGDNLSTDPQYFSSLVASVGNITIADAAEE